MSAAVIAVGNLKGGAGKTTTTLGLADAAVNAGLTVAVIDADPQASITDILEPADPEVAGTKELLRADRDYTLRDCLTETSWPGVLLCPSEAALSHRDRDLEDNGQLGILRDRITAADRRLVDLILIDTSPQRWNLVIASLAAADQVVAVTLPQAGAAIQAVKLTDTLLPQAQQHNRRTRLGGVVLTRYDAREIESRRLLDELRGKYGDLVLEPVGDHAIVTSFYDAYHQRLGDVRDPYAARVIAAYTAHLDRLLPTRKDRP